MNYKYITACACALVFLFLVTSCEKDESIEVAQVEQVADDAPAEEVSEPDFHMHFDANMTEDEVDEAWERGLKKYLSENESLQAKPPTGLTNVLATQIKTKTGSGKYDGTDGSVKITIKFGVQGYMPSHTLSLNNPGDDREGGWDVYYKGHAVGLTSFAFIDEATLQLKGTDGWGVERMIVRLRPQDQIVPATGWSELNGSKPSDFYLDSDYSYQWDSWYKNGGNTGYIHFD